MPMSVLSSRDVLHLAKLANIKLTKKEEESLTSQLSNVIDYFDELKKVPTNEVEPTSQTTGLLNVTRPDEAGNNTFDPSESTSGATNIHNDYFVVPALIDKEK